MERTDMELRTYQVEFGPRDGTARVELLEPCTTEEAQRRRRAALASRCGELLRRGLLPET